MTTINPFRHYATGEVRSTVKKLFLFFFEKKIGKRGSLWLGERVWKYVWGMETRELKAAGRGLEWMEDLLVISAKTRVNIDIVLNGFLMTELRKLNE